MDDTQKLAWLRNYEQQNPRKYLSKFGKVVGFVPAGQPFAGQPNNWEYVSPEEALKKVSPTYAMTGGLQVEIATKDVKQELSLDEAPVKRGRKANV
jgi:hypothetical protein